MLKVILRPGHLHCSFLLSLLAFAACSAGTHVKPIAGDSAPPVSASHSEASPAQGTLWLDWAEDGSATESALHKSSRPLSYFPKMRTFQAETPISLPKDPPEEITLTAEIHSPDSPPRDLKLVESVVERPNDSRPIKSDFSFQVIEKSGRLRLQARMNGLHALLDRNKSESTTLHLKLFSEKWGSFSLKALLRTPPSRLATRAIFGSDAAALLQSSAFPFERIADQDRGYRLVSLFQITSDEMENSILRFPTRWPASELRQKLQEYDYHDYACQGRAYSHELLSKSVQLTDEIYLFPIETGLDPAGRLALNSWEYSLAPGGSLVVGLYVPETGANPLKTWIEKGVIGNQTHMASFPGDCERYCAQEETTESPRGDPANRGGRGGRKGIQEARVCIRYDFRRKAVSLPAGTFWKEPYWEDRGQGLRIQSRYLTAEGDLEGASRDISIPSSDFIIERF